MSILSSVKPLYVIMKLCAFKFKINLLQTDAGATVRTRFLLRDSAAFHYDVQASVLIKLWRSLAAPGAREYDVVR